MSGLFMYNTVCRFKTMQCVTGPDGGSCYILLSCLYDGFDRHTQKEAGSVHEEEIVLC